MLPRKRKAFNILPGWACLCGCEVRATFYKAKITEDYGLVLRKVRDWECVEGGGDA